MVSIDRLDVELLRRLIRDARTGVVELAGALGVARNTIQSRLRRMEHDGVLAGYRAELDLTQLGLPMQAFIGLETRQGLLGSITGALAAIPHVLEVHTTTGREDLLVRLAAATHADLQDTIEQIIGISGVVHCTTKLALTTPLPYRVLPVLDQLTRDAGWGRSGSPAGNPPRTPGGR